MRGGTIGAGGGVLAEAVAAVSGAVEIPAATTPEGKVAAVREGAAHPETALNPQRFAAWAGHVADLLEHLVERGGQDAARAARRVEADIEHALGRDAAKPETTEATTH